MKKPFPLLFALLILAVGVIGFVILRDPTPPATPPNLTETPAEQSAAPEADESATPTEGPSGETTNEPAFATEPRTPWPHETGDITANPRAHFGSLENGLRYVIVPNAHPPKRVSLRLHIDAGSLHEADDQRGIAHFLEHMVFNGSENFPDPKELIPQMQRLGIAFGAHANAYTTFDETVYMLDLPNLMDPTLDLAFTVMRDFADGALLKEAEIDKERGVILSEKNSRDSVQMRLMEQQFDFLMPDSLITHRFPIGIEEVIKNAVRERFTAFYDSYYIPRNMTFIAVGDITVEEMEARVTESFSALTNPSNPGADPELGAIPSGHGFQAAIFSDPEVASDDLSLLKIKEAEPKSDSVSARLERLPLEVAHAIMNRRFSILAKEEESPIRGGSASRGVWFQAIEFGSVDITAAEGRWQDAVGVLEKEFRRAMDYGFTAAELDEIRAKTLNAYEQAVKREPTRESPQIAMQLVQSINSLRTYSTPEEDLRIAREGLENLTPEACHAAFREFWQIPDLNLILTTDQEEEDTRDTLLALYEESSSQPVEPPVEAELVPFAYTDFGEAGTIVGETTIDDLEATQLVLSNEVRVNFKKTDFKKNSISLLARFGSGNLTLPRDKPGLHQLAGALLNGGGLGLHSEDDLQSILAGENVAASFGIGEDALTLSGATTPEDLELQLQLMCAYLVDPGFRDEALRQYRKALPDLYAQLKHDLSGAQAQMAEWLHGGDPRYVIPPLEQALSYTKEDVQSWLLPQLKQDYLELTIVGDFDPATLKPLLTKTFGALAPRASEPSDYPEARSIEFPDTPAQKQFTYQSKIPRAAAITLWEIPGVDEDIARARRFNIVADILGDRMRDKIREELGATYSPQTGASPSTTFPNFGNIIGFSLAKPEDLETINKITVELAGELAENGASEDELDRALKPIISELEQSLRENSYWLGTVLSRSQAEPQRLDWARQRDEDYRSISLEEINALARDYLKPENAIEVQLVPQ
ncbi:MAG: insulinase family protein [Verrucomicrobiota bacterium JB023]|nr:insulinase family protein [Verrucomicrobiota bacterium JB023]